jgi:hypothetical protein
MSTPPTWWTATIAQKVAIVNDLWKATQGWVLPRYLRTPLTAWLVMHPPATADDAVYEIWTMVCDEDVLLSDY